MARFFDKVKGALIVEDEADDNSIDMAKYSDTMSQIMDEETEPTYENVELTEEVGGTTLNAEKIYEISGLTDIEHSIFKVDEIKNVLPANLPTDAKKASVIGMMSVSNITLESVLEDAEKRKAALNTVLTKYHNETVVITEELSAKLVEHEEAINKIKTELINRAADQELQEKIINEELNRINGIVDFIK